MLSWHHHHQFSVTVVTLFLTPLTPHTPTMHTRSTFQFEENYPQLVINIVTGSESVCRVEKTVCRLMILINSTRRDNRRALKLCKRVLDSGRPKQFFNEVKMDEEWTYAYQNLNLCRVLRGRGSGATTEMRTMTQGIFWDLINKMEIEIAIYSHSTSCHASYAIQDHDGKCDFKENRLSLPSTLRRAKERKWIFFWVKNLISWNDLSTCRDFPFPTVDVVRLIIWKLFAFRQSDEGNFVLRLA